MLTFDQVGDLLDQVAEELPPEFYTHLNGGIALLPDELPDPQFPPGEMYILGEYCHDQMGRYINIYYGSFLQVYRNQPDSVWRRELRDTLVHEFTHHIEGMAGERGLEIKDEAFIENALGNYENEP